MAKDKEWVVFKNKLNGLVLARISVRGCFPGEIVSTGELIAEGLGLDKKNITWEVR